MAGAVDGGGDHISINLYPILDVFSILIVFLLMNYSTQSQSVDSSADLTLPKSDTKLNLDDAASVEITKTEVVVQGNLKIPLNTAGEIEQKYHYQGGVKEIFEIFDKVRERNETLRKRRSDLKIEKDDTDTLTLSADQTTKQQVIRMIMLSAQQAEFVRWKLAADKNSIE